MMNRKQLLKLYRELLLDGIGPFWLRHGIDREHGGVLSCMQEDGTPISGDKYIWSQARSVWTFSALYNRVAPEAPYLEAARNSVRFLLAHGRDEQGRWVYRTDRQGRVIDPAISIYSDGFATYGFSECCRAAPDAGLLKVAGDTLRQAWARIQAPDFREVAPYSMPPGHHVHGVPMIFLEVASEYAQTSGEGWAGQIAGECARRILTHHVRPQRKLLIELLDEHYEEVPSPEGRQVIPGHAIESMWFVMHWARRRGDAAAIARAAEVIRWHLEAGWDQTYGGLRLSIDADGAVPDSKWHDAKLWWPHTEALYALLLAYELTGEKWCLEWYERVHEWSFAHYPMPEAGEWWQRLDRAGNRITDVVALPVKDPFHLPRAVILIVQLLGREDGREF